MVKASALEKSGTWVRVLASVRFFICSVAPFFCAALAKRWKVEFRQGFAYFNNNVDSKRHIIIRTAILYNEINSGQIMKKHYIYIFNAIRCSTIYVCIAYLYILDVGSLLPIYRKCTTRNEFALYLLLSCDASSIYMVYIL